MEGEGSNWISDVYRVKTTSLFNFTWDTYTGFDGVIEENASRIQGEPVVTGTNPGKARISSHMK